MKSFISPKVYGFFNYALGIVMILSPWLFGFQHQHGASILLPLYLGWLQLIMAIFSKHEWGFIKVFPVSMHCFIDAIVGSFLLLSPFLYGYYNEIFLPQLSFGLILLLLGVFVQGSPLTSAQTHVFKDVLMEHTGDVDEPIT